MVAERRGNGQDDKPKVPEAPETTQSDQAALEKRKRQSEAFRRWVERNPERAKAASRRSSLKYLHQSPEHEQQARDRDRQWREQNPERARERRRRRREQNPKSKKEAKSGGGETVVFSEFDYWMSEPAKDAATPP